MTIAIWPVRAILLMGTSLLLAAAAESGTLEAGAAKVDITPSADAGLIMSGYADRKEGFKGDRKSTRLNSSHGYISYAVFCLKKKKKRHASMCARRPRTPDRSTAPGQSSAAHSGAAATTSPALTRGAGARLHVGAMIVVRHVRP